MGWEYAPDDRGGEWHEGYLVAEFDDGLRAFAISASGIPAGHLAVDQYGDGTWGQEAVRRHGGDPSFQTRPAGEVIGWRVVCNCYEPGSQTPDRRWFSTQLWVRVPSPIRHDPNAFRIYAADDNILDVISGDASSAAHDVWWREHISDIDAAAAIRAAVDAIRAGEEQLDRAVANARRRNLAWAKIGAAAGMSGQSAHERWSKRTMTTTEMSGPAVQTTEYTDEMKRQHAIGQSLAAQPGLPPRFSPNHVVVVDEDAHSRSGRGGASPGVTPESLAAELRSRGWVAREVWSDDDTEQVCEIDEDDQGHGVDINVYFLRYEPAAWIVGATTHHAPESGTVAEVADRIITSIREDGP